MEYVLTRIDKVLDDTEYIKSTLASLENISAAGPGDVANAHKAAAIGDIVKARETTSQKLLAFYEKMYDDLKPRKAFGPFALSQFESIKEMVEGLPPVQKENIIRVLAGLPQNENVATGASSEQIRQVLEEVRSTNWDDIPDDIRSAFVEWITA